MLGSLAGRLSACIDRSYADPCAAAVDAVRVLNEACAASNGMIVLGLRRKGRPRQNEVCPLGGYRIAFYQRAIPLPPEALPVIAATMATEAYVEEPITAATVANAHQFWVARLSEIAPADVVDRYRRSALARAVGAGDTMRATVPVGPDGVVVLCLDRAPRRARFTAADREHVRELLPAIAPPLRRLGMYHGLIDGRFVLSPREVEVYRLLLTEHSEKQIAEHLGLTGHRAHELVASIFGKLRVSGRNSLWRHWIGAADAGPPAAGSPAGAGRAAPAAHGAA